MCLQPLKVWRQWALQMLIFHVGLRLGSGLKLGNDKSKRKFHRIFFATDVHASEIVFRKFIGAAKFYEADTLVMGGDITGKTVVPMVQDAGGKYHFNFQGQEFANVAPEDSGNFEGRIMNAGSRHGRKRKGFMNNQANSLWV